VIPTAARGSTSSSTTRTSSTSASTAAASSTRRCSCARSATPRSCSTSTTTPRHPPRGERQRHPRIDFELLSSASARPHDIKHPETGETVVKKGRKFTKGHIKQACRSRASSACRWTRRARRQGQRRGRHRREHRRGAPQCNEELTEEQARRLREAASRASRSSSSTTSTSARTCATPCSQDKLHGPPRPWRSTAPAPGRSADARDRAHLFQNLFFNAERYDLSKVGRLKLNYKFKIDEARSRPPCSPSATSSRRSAT
jgi:hypothetical protein